MFHQVEVFALLLFFLVGVQIEHMGVSFCGFAIFPGFQVLMLWYLLSGRCFELRTIGVWCFVWSFPRFLLEFVTMWMSLVGNFWSSVGNFPRLK